MEPEEKDLVEDIESGSGRQDIAEIEEEDEDDEDADVNDRWRITHHRTD